VVVSAHKLFEQNNPVMIDVNIKLLIVLNIF